MAVLNPKEEIVALLRGYFACPLISFLGKHGVLDEMIDKEFSPADIRGVQNKEIFKSILAYFESIGLLKQNPSGEKYMATEIGNKVLKRYGSFCLLHSYGDFLNLLEKTLFDSGYKGIPKVNRRENIIGSGQINNRKYFPSAVAMLKKRGGLTKIIDIGCGNGTFLKEVVSNFPECKVGAVDLSSEALEETKRTLKGKVKDNDLRTILSDGRDVAHWLPKNIDSNNSSEVLVISMWYCIHEISKRDKNEVISFLKEIHSIAPFSEIIIGEITSFPAEILTQNKYETIMPEFLFFHEISGQGVLSWQTYQDILAKIPYTLKGEKLFDLLSYNGKEIPSGFVWHLVPDRRRNK